MLKIFHICNLSVIFQGLSPIRPWMYRKFWKVFLGLLAHVTPSIFFSRILRSEALVYNWNFFQNSRSTGIIRHWFSYKQYKHCNFSRVCLLVKGVENRDKVYCRRLRFWDYLHVTKWKYRIVQFIDTLLWYKPISTLALCVSHLFNTSWPSSISF